jgi:hypothetical protein
VLCSRLRSTRAPLHGTLTLNPSLVISPNVIWFRDHALAYREHVPRNRFSVRRGSWSKTGLSFFQLPAPCSRVAPAVLTSRFGSCCHASVTPKGFTSAPFYAVMNDIRYLNCLRLVSGNQPHLRGDCLRSNDFGGRRPMLTFRSSPVKIGRESPTSNFEQLPLGAAFSCTTTSPENGFDDIGKCHLP